MKVLCGKTDENGGEEGEAEADMGEEEGNGLKVQVSEIEKLWELTVELGEEGKVVIPLYHHSKEDY